MPFDLPSGFPAPRRRPALPGPVTDPALLAQLEGQPAPSGKVVTDPALLAQLEGGRTVADLGRLVRAKYPGAYDDLSDVDLGRKVKAKHPEYSDFGQPPPSAVEASLGIGTPQAPTTARAVERSLEQIPTFGFAPQARAVAYSVSRYTPDEAAELRRRAELGPFGMSREDLAAGGGTPRGAPVPERLPAETRPVPGFGGSSTAAYQQEFGREEALHQQLAEQHPVAYFGPQLLPLATSAVGALARRGAGLVSRGLAAAETKATARATTEKAAELASARGALGAETQKGSRYLENLMRLEESMTPEQRALYAQLQESGAVPNLQQSIAQNTLEKLPGQAATIAERRATLNALEEAAQQSIADRASALLSPAEAKAQIASRLRRYGPVGVLGALAGHALGGPGGALLGGAAGAAVRPAIHATRRMLTNPAVQYQALRGAEQLTGVLATPAEAQAAGSDLAGLLAALRAKAEAGW